MWLEDINEFSELFKGCFPYYLLVVLPIFIAISPINPVGAAHEFPVYRMQQYDLHGLPHGCRSSAVNLEARSLTSWSTNRHCIVARLQDITAHQLREIRSKAGALLIVLPKDMNNISPELQQQMMELEEDLLSQEIFIPVYFASWTNELQSILDDVSSSIITNEKAGSAAEAFLDAISANGYQIVISASQSAIRNDVHVANIQGKLSGQGVEENLPTIAIVAHYDSYGVAPELSFGADSNGSGVAILLELARIFSMLYSNAKTHAPYNLIFLLSGAGKFNYLGSKKWLEDQIDGLEGSLIQEAAFVLCLDSLSNNSTLHLHVSKPPKEQSSRGLFYKELQEVAGESNVQMVHKKINLADDLLAWEHERYGIRRLPAITLSAFQSHKDLRRTTIFDRRDTQDLNTLTNNAKIIAQAIARHIYNNSKIDVLSEHHGVESESLRAILDHISNQPRSSQLLAEKNNPLVNSLKEILAKYAKDVKVTTLTPDKRDPDFVFYDVTKSIVHVYSVKPAVFDLFLTIAIVVYLSLVYVILTNFSYIYVSVTKLEIATQTIPPPRNIFSELVTQWVIWDAYSTDFQKQQKEKEKEKKPPPATTVNKKEEVKKKQDALVAEAIQLKTNDAAKIVDRMICQNIYDEIAQDYKYYEDPSDEYRNEEGTLLPLWKFCYEKTKKNSVTDLSWNPQYYDLFAVTFGTFDFSKQPVQEGAVCLFTLKNPSYPEYIRHTESGAMSVAVHPNQTYLIVIGMYDGNVAVYNTHLTDKAPQFQSNSVNNKHWGIVWQVKWGVDMQDGEINFFSVSADGKVYNWVLMQNELAVTTVIALNLPLEPIAGPDGAVVNVKGCGCTINFHPLHPLIFLVGTEEGSIYKCSTAYSSMFLFKYDAHHMPVHKISYNLFYPDIFLSCSADWRVKIWEDMRSEPLFVFDLGCSVGDVQWAPYSSTVFAAVTVDGKCHVFDININKYRPVCVQNVISRKRNRLTRLRFNYKMPILVVGDDKGCVTTLKLSPNLRIKPKPPKKQQFFDPRMLEIMKLEKLLALVREPSNSAPTRDNESVKSD